MDGTASRKVARESDPMTVAPWASCRTAATPQDSN